MASNKRTVELDIRARDEASRALDSVSKSLNDITRAQEGLVKSAKSTDDVLGNLGDEAGKLNAELKGLTSLGQIVSEMDKATAAVASLQKQIQQSGGEVSRLNAAYREAQNVTEMYRNSMQQARQAITDINQALTRSRSEQTQANKAVVDAESRYRRLADSVNAAANPSARLVQQLRDQAFALNDARVRQEAAGTAVARNSELLSVAEGRYRALKASVDNFTTSERALKRELDGAQSTLTRTSAALVTQETSLFNISRGAAQASRMLGGVAAEEGAVAQATQRANQQLAETNRLLNTLGRARPDATPRSNDTVFAQQAQAARQSVAAVQAAREEVKRLAIENRNAAQPTAVLTGQLAAARVQLREAQAAAAGARSALEGLRNSTGGGFKIFAAAEASRVREVRDTLNSFGTTSAQGVLARMREALRSFTSATGPAKEGVDKVNASIRRMGEDSRRSLSLVQRLRGQLLSLAAGYIGLQAAVNQAGGVVQAFQTIEAASSRLGVVFQQNSAAVDRELQWLQRQAQRLGIELGVLSDEYGKLAVAAQTANFTNEETRRLFLSVAEAARVNKLSVDQTRGVFLALNQMISKGKVSSEELRRQLGDRLAGAFQIFASALGLSTAELDKQMKAGEVYADRATLLKFADELNKRFGPQLASSLNTVTTEIGRFRDNVLNAQLRVGQGGFMEAFRVALVEINKGFRSREGRDFFLSLGAAMGSIVQLTLALARNFELISLALRVFIGLRVASYLTNILSSGGRVVGLFATLTTNISNSNKQLAALSGRGALESVRSGITGAVAGMKNLFVATTQARAAATGLNAQMNAVGATTAVATQRMTFFGAAAASARGALALLAGTVRTIVSLFGGWLGLILTGIVTLGTYLAGEWFSNVDDATKAIDEHNRIMQEVVASYEEAANKSGDWLKNVEGVTASQVGENLKKQIAQLREMEKIFRDQSQGVVTQSFFVTPDAGRQLQELTKAVMKGSITFEEYREQLDALYKQYNDLDPVIGKAIADQQELAQTVLNQQRVVREAAVLADKYGLETNGLSKEAQAAGVSLNTMANGVSNANAAFDPSAITEYEEALASLKKAIPSLKSELDRLAQEEALTNAFQSIMDSQVATTDQKREATNLYDRALSEIAQKAIEELINDDVVRAIIQGESGGRNVRSNTSSASGPGQFIESTWLGLLRRYLPTVAEGRSRDEQLSLRGNRDIVNELVAAYARENVKTIQGMGVAVNDSNIKMVAALAHFADGRRAGQLLQADRNAPASQFFSPKEIAANKQLLGGDVGQILAYFEKRNGLRNEELEINQKIAQDQQEEIKRQQDFLTEFDERLAGKQNELSALKDSTREYAIQKALEEEQTRARKVNVTLDEDRLNTVRQIAGALFDQKTEEARINKLKRDSQRASREALKLEEERATLLEQYRTAMAQSDNATLGEIETRVNEINETLPETVEYARQLAAALGDQKTLDALNKIKVESQEVNKGLFTGQQIAEQLSQGGASAFDEFSQSIANGVGFLDSLRQAFLRFASDFLRQIAQMIIQQTLFRSLFGGGEGGGAASGIAGFLNRLVTGVFHSGGVAGRTPPATRAVSPAWFANARRYHSGGLPGLSPSEVPAILKRGEEVLTTDDPRNVLNGGLGGSRDGGVKVINTFDSGSFISEGVNTKQGERAILNFVRANSAAVRSALQG